jgi:alpha-tubulin suppressor-like RCC1 family protein
MVGAGGCALSAWGDNTDGYLGDGTVTEHSSRVLMNFPTGTQIKQIASGAVMSEVLKTDGTVWGMGRGSDGEMGNSQSNATNNVPTQANISGVVSIAAGQYTVYAVKNDGTVWAWGFNGYGQVGDNSGRPNVLSPAQVVGLNNVVQVSSERFTGIALKNDGTVWTWGEDSSGDLGNNTQCSPNSGCEGSPVPVQVHGPGNAGFLTGIVAIAGGGEHSVALRSDGTVWAWGSDNYGELGDANSPNAAKTPVQMLSPDGVNHLTGVVSIAGGFTFSLMLESNGTVLAVGSNNYGELGNNNAPNNAEIPVQVAGLSGVTAIAAGYDHGLAVESDGSLWSWGKNDQGQLGIGAGGGQRNTPVRVAGMSHVTAIAGGVSSSIAVGDP